jgi:hypothetical protein
MTYSVEVERTLSKSAMFPKVQNPPNVFLNVYFLVPPEMGAVAIESFRGNCASFFLKRKYKKNFTLLNMFSDHCTDHRKLHLWATVRC